MLTIIFSAKFPLEKEGGLYQNKVNFSLTFTQGWDTYCVPQLQNGLFQMKTQRKNKKRIRNGFCSRSDLRNNDIIS